MTPALLAVALAAGPLDAATLTAAELGPNCKDGVEEVGSLHARVSFESGMQKPKAKATKNYDCGGTLGSAYLSEFATAKETELALALTGAELWGEGGPSVEHDDQIFFKGAQMVVLSGDAVEVLAKKYAAKGFMTYRGKAAAAAVGAPAGAVVDGDAPTRVAAAVDCKSASADPLRPWCAVTLIKNKGYAPPTKRGIALGISAPLGKGKDVREALLKQASVSVLGFNAGKLTVRDLKPENADEAKELAQVAAQVAVVLKSGAPAPIKVSKGLHGFLATIPDGATAEVKPSAKKAADFTLKNPAHVSVVTVGKVSVYVVVEDAVDGSWVNLFPFVPVAAQ
ncbi:MAG: hypothetical protein K1X89_22040 [Myxococcaceae bacterium]|nr:hypothetical protein [Myxococcaceae bacterium]